MKKISVIGSGSWGMALAQHMSKKAEKVYVWSYSEEEKDMINNEKSTKYLKEIVLNDNIICSNSYEEVLKDTELVLHVTPSKYTRSILNEYKKYLNNSPIVICSKGFEEGTLYRLEQVFEEEATKNDILVLSGPSYAIEVAKSLPTAIILASKNKEVLEKVSKIIADENMRIYKSSDIVGVEIGAALKNVIALCTGIAVELGFGTNAISALITRGLVEISRLGVKMGAKDSTFYGLSGLGDLILTCSSDESRNRRAGKLIGKGLSIEEIKKEINMTVESLDNILVVKKLAEKYDVSMPICETAYDILHNGMDVKLAAKELMTRKLKFEN